MPSAMHDECSDARIVRKWIEPQAQPERLITLPGLAQIQRLEARIEQAADDVRIGREAVRSEQHANLGWGICGRGQPRKKQPQQ